MNRRLALPTAVAILAGVASPAVATPAKKLTQARAEAAIQKKVKASYRKQVGSREIQASCERTSSRRYKCEYGVLTGSEDATDDQDRNPYAFEGTGSVKQGRNGKLVVTVTRPR